MAVQIPTSDLNKEWDNYIMQELTFYPKENTNLKYNQDVKSIACFKATPEFTSLPMHWASKELEIETTYKHDKIDIEPRVVARDKKQQKEYDELVDMLMEEKTATLTVRTGGGKTFLFLNCACALGLRTVVLVWIQDHIEQIVNSIQEFTTATIGVVSTKGLDNIDADIVVCLYTRWNKLSLKQRKSFGFLVVDELHLFYNNKGMEAILAYYPKFGLGCTATFENKNTDMHKLALPIFGKNYISSAFDIPFDVIKILTGIKGTREKNKYLKPGIDYSVLTKSLMYNPERNILVVNLVEIRLSQGCKILIITDEKEHTKLLWELLCAKGISCDYLAGKKKTYIDSDVLVGISKLCAVGFDEKAKCPGWKGVRINKVILPIGVNSQHRLVQILGRSLRSDNPSIDHLVDDDTTIERQFQNMANEVYIPLKGKMEVCELSE